MFLRTRAPKARASTNCATPAGRQSYRVHHPPNLSATVSRLETSSGEGQTVRSAEEFDDVHRLIAAGMNDCAIARQTGIPRPTVREWRGKPPNRLRRPSASSPCGVLHDFSALPRAAYSYLLGLYLGDGCISRVRRVWRLRIVLDLKYPAIINRCCEAIDAVMPANMRRSCGNQPAA
jgi:hypothetical protein